MELKNCSFDNFIRYIKEKEKSIICYGAGMLPLYIEPLLSQYDLLRNIYLFVDSNREKEGKTVAFQEKNIKIAGSTLIFLIKYYSNIKYYTSLYKI